MTTPDPNTRERLALALDVADLDRALGLVRGLRPWFGVAKVGLELFSASGPRAVEAVRDEGLRVFLDVKLHDIPATVGGAARALGGLGVELVTVHTSGGTAMVRAAVDGLEAGARDAGRATPGVLGVTVLTSDPDISPLDERVRVAVDAGCRGVVCAASDVVRVKSIAPHLAAVVPGIRLPGDARHDQARIATPADALANGADLLVVGRTVTAADDPEEAASRVHVDAAGARA
jgi:orotidine-5'-phosphate decarboxylase